MSEDIFKAEYGNDTGPNDDYFVQFWDVIHIKSGVKMARCDEEEKAEIIKLAMSDLFRKLGYEK